MTVAIILCAPETGGVGSFVRILSPYYHTIPILPFSRLSGIRMDTDIPLPLGAHVRAYPPIPAWDTARVHTLVQSPQPPGPLQSLKARSAQTTPDVGVHGRIGSEGDNQKENKSNAFEHVQSQKK